MPIHAPSLGPGAAPPSDIEEPRYRRAIVVANPIAGRGRAARAGGEIAQALRGMGVHADLHVTGARGDGRAWLRSLEQPVDLAVAVGGDGTVREVLDGLVDSDVPVAVVPMGTANVLALDLDLPRDVDQVLAIVRGGRTTALDVGTVNGHLSFLVSGIGLDAAALRELERRRNGPITKWHYTRAILGALRGYREPRLEVEIDGEQLDGHFGLVLISNIIHYGGLLKLSRERKLDDGRFEVFLFRRARRRELAATALRGFLSELPGGPCTMRTCTHVRVRSEEPVPYHVDGDWRGETPVEFEISRRRYRILIP